MDMFGWSIDAGGSKCTSMCPAAGAIAGLQSLTEAYHTLSTYWLHRA